MRCERARVPTYVWARDPGEKRAFSKQESYFSELPPSEVEVGSSLESFTYRRVRLYSCVFWKAVAAEAVSGRPY